MKKADFPYTGFWTSWFFEDPTAIEYEQYLIDRIASPQICEDIKQVLLINILQSFGDTEWPVK